MLSLKYRPQTFDEIEGQEIPKKVLKKVVDKPENNLRVFLLQGAWGTGKTCIARVFGRAINCKGKNKPCLKCSSCLQYNDILSDPRYQELDTAIVGNVKDIRNFRESWYNVPLEGYRTIVFDEVQSASRMSMDALLTFVEDPPKNVFIFFNTTEPDKLIKPLISRSFILNFYPIQDSDMISLIKTIEDKENIVLSDKTRDLIIKRAEGHARDAVFLIELCFLLGEEQFLKTVVMADDLIMRIFKNAVERKGGREEIVKNLIEELAKIPLQVLNSDFERVMKFLANKIFVEGVKVFEVIDENMLMKMFSFYAKIAPVMRKNTSDYCSSVMAFYNILKSEKPLEESRQTSDRFKKI